MRGGQAAEVADELEPLRFASAERIQRLAEREIAEADLGEHGEPALNVRLRREKRQRVADGRVEQIGDRAAVPGDRQHLWLEAAAFADRARHEDVGEELHLDAFVAEPLAVVAAAVAAVEREAAGAVTGLLRGGRRGVELPDELPCLGVERRIGPRRAADRRLVDKHDIGEFEVGADLPDAGGILRRLVTPGEQALVDDVVQQR